MRHEKQAASAFLKTFICLMITASLTAMAHAQGAAVNPTGTWTWSNPGRNGGPARTNTLVLKYSGSAVTGTATVPVRVGGTTNLDISEGKLAGDQISFNIVRENNGNSATNSFAGAVTADSITGTISSERDGEKRSRKWEAKRSAPAAN